MAKLTRKQRSARSKAAWRTRRLNAKLAAQEAEQKIAKETNEANAPAKPTSRLAAYEEDVRRARSDVQYAEMQLTASQARLDRAELELTLVAKSILAGD